MIGTVSIDDPDVQGTRRARLVGPIGGDHPPFGAPDPELLEAKGYLVEEFQLEGETVGYAAVEGTTPGIDGRWQVEEQGLAPYRTRILVVRPTDPGRFNGTVVLNWQNVSGGYEMGTASGDELLGGFAWVGVSAQEVGLYGFPMGMDRNGGTGTRRPLVDQDPERYGALEHPGDQGAYEMFTQAARAVGPDRRDPIDPLGGLRVERIIATGASQSAMRLVCYLNAVHPRDRVIDAFLLSVWEGRAPRPEEGPVAMGVRTRVRDDLPTPVFVVNSEFEVPHLATVEAGDTATIRIWEVAGSPHGPLPPGRPNSQGWEPNSLSIGPVYQSALRWTQRWLTEGAVPPHQPRVEVEGGPAPRVRRDDQGNAVGGIRLPELEAPVRQYKGMAIGTGRPPLFGASRPLPDVVIQALHSSREAYLERWNRAVAHLVDTGAIRPEDRAPMQARGEAVDLPF